MAGGDTDTNGAIAGALLGAVHIRPVRPPRSRPSGTLEREPASEPEAGQSGGDQPA